MSTNKVSILKTVAVALVLCNAAAYAPSAAAQSPAPGSVEAWQQAKYPLLFTPRSSPANAAYADADHAAKTQPISRVEAWMRAKFPWLYTTTAGMQSAHPARVAAPGSFEAWRQAKYPWLSTQQPASDR